MEIADTAFSPISLSGLAVIFANSKLIKSIHIHILLILIDLCIDFKWGGGEGFGSKGESKAH